jgi:hypothetical protein
MMRPSDSLRVVLAVRRLKEDAEERILAALGRQIQQAMTEVERLEAELVSIKALRLEEVHCLLSGIDHQRSEARHRQVKEGRLEALSQIETLETMRLGQMETYLAARCGREVISELLEQRMSAYQADLGAREQKRNEDLFLSRRARS